MSISANEEFAYGALPGSTGTQTPPPCIPPTQTPQWLAVACSPSAPAAYTPLNLFTGQKEALGECEFAATTTPEVGFALLR